MGRVQTPSDASVYGKVWTRYFQSHHSFWLLCVPVPLSMEQIGLEIRPSGVSSSVIQDAKVPLVLDIDVESIGDTATSSKTTTTNAIPGIETDNSTVYTSTGVVILLPFLLY